MFNLFDRSTRSEDCATGRCLAVVSTSGRACRRQGLMELKRGRKRQYMRRLRTRSLQAPAGSTTTTQPAHPLLIVKLSQPHPNSGEACRRL